ncbi:Ribosomal RNA small subunit methyltransferase C [Buchnera aphidicola (Protaphis terricola)]|uniref:16S rRNA (guanine(1207)-N(2))-methyltransferase RsmC n=1 Tax=Buchnera aphidicola TaxID=9 RepID=UPI003464E46D
MLFSQNSQLILRYKKIFKYKKIFFSGNIQDHLPVYLPSIKTGIHITVKNIFFHEVIKNYKKIYLYENLIVSKKNIKNYNALIYYWPKNKLEAKFQLYNLLSCFSINDEIFIVGNNSSGVKNAIKILKKWVILKKLENAKHSILFSGIIKNNTTFVLKNYFKTHTWENLFIKTLPGVFGYKKIDTGSKLLACSINKQVNGEILDIGCGSGFLSACILNKSPNSFLTMIDNKISAIISSQSTLSTNNFKGKILFSNTYSNINNKFDLIISNPPFHNDLKIDFYVIKDIITNSIKYLKIGGELRFVVNNFFNCKFILKNTFNKYNIIEKTNFYTVYQSFLR